MTTVTSTQTAATGSNLFGAGVATTPAAQQQQFLQLLIAQMQNQDPMNPMDNAQITSQMAQISTVSGLNTLNNTMTGLAAVFDSGQSLQTAALIGRTVMAPSTALTLANGQANGGVDLPADADSVKVTIKDAAGNTVQTLDLGAQKAGIVPFTWNGTDAAGNAVAAGTYSMSVAASTGGASVSAATLAAGQVQSVTLANGAVGVTAGSLGTIDLSQIAEIL